MRLSLALEEGLELSGPVLVRHPGVETDLSALTDFDVETPDIRVAERFGDVNPEPRDYAASLIIAPRAKDLARDLIATAPGALVVVDGQKTDGIDSLWRECRKRAEVMGSVTKAHGRIFWMKADQGAFADWEYEPPDLHGFALAPGIFSADGIDPGSYALAEVLPEKIEGSVIDLGAGWGYLSAVAEARGATEIDMVEANAMALACAEANTRHAQGHWADATRWQPTEKADHVIMNPPFHEGRRGTPELGREFIANAARCLTPKGTLWMVANRHLPYEDALAAHFSKVSDLTGPPGTEGFKLFQATRPKR
ncbi:MAG: class I SAM-dependent methyltransferase [Pseudomonadota bacterium]